MRELVSVMLVSHNGLPYLQEAVDSVREQTYRPIEIVLVDDGSTDDTPQFAAQRGQDLVYVRQERGGIASARNLAARRATGEYLTYLDADDRMRPSAIAAMADVLDRLHDVDVVFAHVDEFISPDLADAARRRLRPPGKGLPGRLPTTMLCRRETFFSVGPFDTTLRRGVTLDWTARALEAGTSTALLPDVLFDRRLHARNNGLLEHASTHDYLRVVKASLDRRRRPGVEGAGLVPTTAEAPDSGRGQ